MNQRKSTSQSKKRKLDSITKLRAPELSIFLKWITDACDKLEKPQIQNSFMICGITWGLHENTHINQKLLSLFEDLVSKVTHLLLAYVNII